MFEDFEYKSYYADYFLAITALLQPVLTLLQLLFQDAFHFEPDYANNIRVFATAIPVIFSMFIVIHRNMKMTLFIYSIALFVVFFTITIFPERWTFMSSDVLKFTLPVVIPTGLCLASINNMSVLIKSMHYISIAAAIIGLVYAFLYLSGSFLIDSYSMSFSYALLLPTFILINRKGIIWKFIVILLILEMLAIGSRGALMISIVYWFFSVLRSEFSLSTIIIYASILLGIYFFFFYDIVNIIADTFDSIGINSRTLRLFLDNEIISHTSGRDEVYEKTWELIEKHPFWGSGIWADRQYLGMYCHNIFLELLLDFGYIGGGIVILAFTIKQVLLFRILPDHHKTLYFMMIAVLCPLLVSSSYLTSFNVGMFLGFTYLLEQQNLDELCMFYVNESLVSR